MVLLPASDWDNDRAWLLMAFGEKRQYAGNRGYSDKLASHYLYDSFVPNHQQLAVGDVVVLVERERIFGYARIEKIERSPGTKLHYRCPAPGCRTTAVKERLTKRPRYRCNFGHEFDEPLEEEVECTKFVAEYGKTFVPEPLVVSPEVLKSAWLNQRDQAAIRKARLSRVLLGLPRTAAIVLRAIAGSSIAPLESLLANEGDEGGLEVPQIPAYDAPDWDRRDTVLRQVRARRGQTRFRDGLRRRYGDRCQVSGSGLVALLEAAHIRPYRGEEDHHPDNGLLLRADLHTLFDLDLLGIEPDTLSIRMNPGATEHGYGDFHGQRLRCDHGRPDTKALEFRWVRFHQRHMLEL